MIKIRVTKSSLFWMLQRLAKMSPGEVLFRLWRIFYVQFRKLKSRRHVFSTDGSISAMFESETLSSQQKLFSSAILDRFYNRFDEKWIKLAREYYPGEFEKVVQRLLQRKYHILGFGEVQGTQSIPWHLDFATGKNWPQIFYGDIDFRFGDEIGDIRLSWELNRHHYTMMLAKAYLLADDRTILEEVKYLFYDWVQKNPVDIGINWISAMESSIRIHSWLWTYVFVASRSPSEHDFLIHILKAIYNHAKHIERNLSLYSSANNHLIVEVSSLIIAGVLLPFFKDSQKWVKRGIGILEKELKKQVYPDGVNAEQSTHYQVFVTEALLIVIILMRRNHIPLPDVVSGTTERMCEFLRLLCDQRGKIPNIGDSDEGHIIKFSEESESVVINILAVGAVIFNRPDYTGPKEWFGEYAFWLLGSEGQHLYEDLIEQADVHVGSKVFDHGGYAVLRAKGELGVSLTTFDFGPFGYPPLNAHAHADLLNLTLAIGNTRVLVDSGTFLYSGVPECRDYFRSTMAHNTITIGNISQALPDGTFSWGTTASAQSSHQFIHERVDFVEGFHEAYTPTTHWRCVLFVRPNIWLVIDRLISPTEDEYIWESRFHFPPCEVSQTQGCYQVNFQELSVSIVPLLSSGTEVNIQDTWISQKYGQKLKTSVLTYNGIGKKTTVIPTLIHAPAIDPQQLSLEENVLQITTPSCSEIRYLAFDQVNNHRLKFSGTCLYMLGTEKGDISFAYSPLVDELVWKGKALLKASTRDFLWAC